MILQELKQLQDASGFLRKEDLAALAARLRVPLHVINEVASYYPYFCFDPPPRATVQVCRDLACHLGGSEALYSALRRSAADASEGRIRIEAVSCLGRCDQPPAVAVNHSVYPGLSEAQLTDIIRAVLAGDRPPHPVLDSNPLGWKLPSGLVGVWPGAESSGFPRACWHIDPYHGEPHYAAVRKLVADGNVSNILNALESAGLRGMGGAGFPTHRKWRLVREAQSEVKYVICNADESEPGTFKDRELLRRLPHQVIEGLVLAGLCTGATRGWIYIRHEYNEETRILQQALDAARKLGVLGSSVLGSAQSFDVEIVVSPGGYVQGEESALLEALEDRRGAPRNKPPFPVTHGLFNKPTVINNVETLAWAAAIANRGGDWFRSLGERGSAGMRFVSVCGDVIRPGVYEVPFGQTVRELIHETAGGLPDGRALQAIATSGPSSGFLPARIAWDRLPGEFAGDAWPGTESFDIMDLQLDFDTLGKLGGMLGGAFVVLAEGRDLLAAALNCTEFFRNESCGKCVPCRLGTEKLAEIVKGMFGGTTPSVDEQAIADISLAMRQASICGLGQVAGNPILSIMNHFRVELSARHKPPA